MTEGNVPSSTKTVSINGIEISAVGLGCNNFGGRIDLAQSEKVIHQALDSGITLFDTADIYGNRGGSEVILGQVLGARRKDIVLATKFAGQMDDAGKLKGTSGDYVKQAAEASLKRLKTDVIDLYQIHFPVPEVPIEETLRALDDLVKEGKVREIGCSNFPSWQVVDALWTSQVNDLAAFVSCQDEYSLLKRDIEADLMPAMRAKDLFLLPYFPLASGLLSGKYKRDGEVPDGTRFAGSQGLVDRWMTDANWSVIETLTSFANERGHSLLDLAFAWLLAKDPVASVIAGATKPEQIVANVKAGEWRLSDEETTAVDEIVRG